MSIKRIPIESISVVLKNELNDACVLFRIHLYMSMFVNRDLKLSQSAEY